MLQHNIVMPHKLYIKFVELTVKGAALALIYAPVS